MPVLVAAALGAFLLSTLSTFLVDRLLTQRISIIGAFVGLERVENAGIAFGIDLPAVFLITLVPLALLLIAILAWKSRRNRVHSIGFGLILGGALANIADRLGDGLVTDFIQVGIWPTFNVADSCITVGVGILLLRGLGGNARPENVL